MVERSETIKALEAAVEMPSLILAESARRYGAHGGIVSPKTGLPTTRKAFNENFAPIMFDVFMELYNASPQR